MLCSVVARYSLLAKYRQEMRENTARDTSEYKLSHGGLDKGVRRRRKPLARSLDKREPKQKPSAIGADFLPNPFTTLQPRSATCLFDPSPSSVARTNTAHQCRSQSQPILNPHLTPIYHHLSATSPSGRDPHEIIRSSTQARMIPSLKWRMW